MKRVILSILVLPIFASANCKVLETKHINKGKDVVKKEKLCFFPNSSKIVSKNCLEKKCEAFRVVKKKRALERKYGPIGNPLFKLCHHYGGRPQIYKYYHNKTWKKASRCLFKKDNSFIDNSLYLELNNKKRENSESDVFELLNY